MARARAAKRPKRERLIGDTPAEKRAARKLARELCAGERDKLKHWIPTERARVKAAVAKVRADAKIEIARLNAQLTSDIRRKREETSNRVCVDMMAGPIVRRFGPKRPPTGPLFRGKRGRHSVAPPAPPKASKAKGKSRPKARRPRRR
jgi:hypothetical protein